MPVGYENTDFILLLALLLLFTFVDSVDLITIYNIMKGFDMKVAVTSEGSELSSAVDPRFGRAKYFILVDDESGEFEARDNQQNLNAAQGAGIQAGRNVIEMGAEAVITGNVGPNAIKTLHAGEIKVYLCQAGLTVQEAVNSLKAGELKLVDQANVEGHWV